MISCYECGQNLPCGAYITLLQDTPCETHFCSDECYLFGTSIDFSIFSKLAESVDRGDNPICAERDNI